MASEPGVLSPQSFYCELSVLMTGALCHCGADPSGPRKSMNSLPLLSDHDSWAPFVSAIIIMFAGVIVRCSCG